MTRDILNHLDEVIGTMTLPDKTSEDVWIEKLAPYAQAPHVPTSEEIVATSISKAAKFGLEIIDATTVENVLMGITQARKTAAVSNYCHKLIHYLQTGYLYAAVDEIDAMIAAGVPQDLSPFVTEERLTECKTKLNQYLGVE